MLRLTIGIKIRLHKSRVMMQICWTGGQIIYAHVPLNWGAPLPLPVRLMLR